MHNRHRRIGGALRGYGLDVDLARVRQHHDRKLRLRAVGAAHGHAGEVELAHGAGVLFPAERRGDAGLLVPPPQPVEAGQRVEGPVLLFADAAVLLGAVDILVDDSAPQLQLFVGAAAAVLAAAHVLARHEREVGRQPRHAAAGPGAGSLRAACGKVLFGKAAGRALKDLPEIQPQGPDLLPEP